MVFRKVCPKSPTRSEQPKEELEVSREGDYRIFLFFLFDLINRGLYFSTNFFKEFRPMVVIAVVDGMDVVV